MTPPLPQVRQRSIERWMTENRPHQRATTKAIQSLDSQMMQAFEASEEGLMESMMSKGTWGHPEPMRQFETQRLELWASVADEFLPVTSDLSLVG